MHHSRRKSGHGSANTSMTDVRKTPAAADVSSSSSRYKPSRPAPLARKSAPQTSSKLAKSPRDRDRDWDEDRWWDEEGESFPQYCMTCEKQFVPHDDKYPYCSEACRMHDQSNTPASSTPSRTHTSHADSHLFYASGNPEPKDIIPRASPSRPSSMHFSSPAAAAATHTSAISALRSLSIRDSSPPSPSATYHSTIWPFTSSTRSAAASPSTWYTRPSSTVFSSTYDTGYDGAGYGMTSDRPLPSRRPGTHSRPKSIELLTPAW